MVQSDNYAIEVTSISIGKTKLSANADTLGPAIIASGDKAISLPLAVYNSAVQAIIAGQTHLKPSFFANKACIAEPTGIDFDALPALTLTVPNENSEGTSAMTYPADLSYITFLDTASGARLMCPALASSGANGAMVLGNALMRTTMTIINWPEKLVTLGPSVGICS